jgi:hypothetical protein
MKALASFAFLATFARNRVHAGIPRFVARRASYDKAAGA